MLGETPILRQLTVQVQRSRFPLHVPGHQQGRVLPGVLSTWLGSAPLVDLTELPGLDNLHDAKECIAESAALAAAHYGSDVCLYSVNGSSAGVMAAIAGVVREGQSVLFLNPFHVSAWRGLVQAGAIPILPTGWFGPRAERLSVPNLEDVARVLQAHRGRGDIGAVYLTSPTYRGEAADVGAIAGLAHEQGLPIIVDEAHGAHFGLHSALPAHSVAQGADVVVHSVHKTLPGLTQVAWVHVRESRVAPERIADALYGLTTTSPSYLLLASLDAAQAWLRLEGEAAAQHAYEVLQPLWNDELPVRVGTAHRGGRSKRDFLRRFERGTALSASRRLQAQLEQAGLFPEYADAEGVLSIFGFGVTPAVVSLYTDILARWLAAEAPVRELYSQTEHVQPSPVDARAAIRFAMPPRAVWLAERQYASLSACKGRIAALPITPYPPGVPVIWPGQVLDEETVELLQTLCVAGTEVHGLKADGTLAVVAEGAPAERG